MSQPTQKTTDSKAARIYDEYVPQRIDRDNVLDVLRNQAYLGIEGHTAEANAQRGDRAEQILAEHNNRADRAYREARWPREPQLPDTTLISHVAETGGDLHAIEDDTLRSAVITAFDARGGEQYLSDEDGPRYEWVDPMDDPAVADAVENTLAELREIIQGDGVTTAAAACPRSD